MVEGLAGLEGPARRTAPPRTVAEVVARLRAIERGLPHDDGAAVFDSVYLRVTQMIAAELEIGTVFHDPHFMAALDVRFACLWLSAYDSAQAGLDVPKAWAPLFTERRTPGIWPIQYALAGMNAHIENDLPLAVVQTCDARGVSPTHASVHEDFEKVNDLLASVESEIRHAFLTEIGKRVDEEIGPLVHLVSAWNIEKARDLAWITVETLWALRPFPSLTERWLATLGRTVGLASRCLLTPVGPAPEPPAAGHPAAPPAEMA
jgi:hypothetical protein